MILFDTSAWIRYLNKGSLSFDQLQRVAVCPPVIQEVLQGVREPQKYEVLKAGLLALPCLCKEVDLDLYLEASEIYRVGRRKGITIRSTVDCLIATIAIKFRISVHHFDRDFAAIATFTALQVADP